MTNSGDLPSSDLSYRVLGAAFEVHRALGPGLLERIYEACLYHELIKRGVEVERQATLPIVYNGMVIDDGLRLDLVVEAQLILEIKAVETVLPIHRAQILTYLRLSGYRLGLLIKFNVERLTAGIQRVVL
ncbi:GxxExxY protein [Rhodovibrio sodomensis]|uniref:GxxExxY protein n=1 Tax=Rhodovibrio sodomensis TaxID=1088 RepID=UPI001F5BB45B|nr:GxxExxY protein [Rhodovibrio sodomensis]